MMTGFCESAKQFCYDTRLAVKVSNPLVGLKFTEGLRKFVKHEEINWVSFDMGIKSVNENFEFYFCLEEPLKQQ